MFHPKDGTVFRNWAPDEWHPSPKSPKWIEQSAAYCSQAVQRMGVDGIYLDELGNGTQYKGYWGPDMKKIDQRSAENDLTRACLEGLSNRLAMCEFPPVDRMAGRYQAVLNDSASVLDIYRFAFPMKKIFRVIRCDYPLGDDMYSVNKAFFNGEGLWLDNDLRNEQWYPAHILERIRSQYQVLREYAEYFDSEDALPLAEGTDGTILVNCFYGPRGRMICAINTSAQEAELKLPVRGREQARVVYQEDITEAWPGKQALRLRIKGHGVCAVLMG